MQSSNALVGLEKCVKAFGEVDVAVRAFFALLMSLVRQIKEEGMVGNAYPVANFGLGGLPIDFDGDLFEAVFAATVLLKAKTNERLGSLDKQ